MEKPREEQNEDFLVAIEQLKNAYIKQAEAGKIDKILDGNRLVETKYMTEILKAVKDQKEFEIRSNFYQSLDGICDGFIPKEAQTETIKEVYRYAYLVKEASIRKCSLLNVEGSEDLLDCLLTDFRGKSINRIDGSIVKLLREMTKQAFANLCYKNKNTIDKWKAVAAEKIDDNSKKLASSLSYAITKETAQIDKDQDRRDLLAQFAIAAVAAGIAFVFSSIEGTGDWWIAIALLLTILEELITPANEFFNWSRNAKISASSVVHLTNLCKTASS